MDQSRCHKSDIEVVVVNFCQLLNKWMLHFFWNSAFIFGFITFLFLCTNLKEIVRCVRLYAQLRFIFLSWSKKSENVWRRKVASSWKQRGTKQAEKIWSIYNLKKGIGNLISDFRTSFQLSITSSSSSLRDKISQKGLKNKCSEGEESIAKILQSISLTRSIESSSLLLKAILTK